MTKRHIGHQVMELLDRLGVSPLIRNYHLFYHCIANTADQELRAAVRNLGNQPTQQEIDRVIEEFVPEAAGSTTMRKQQDAILSNIESLSSRLTGEQNEMQSFSGAVDKLAEALAKSASADKVTPEMLARVTEVLVDASRQRLANGHKTMSQVQENKGEIDALKSELVRVRQLANTDALTGVANRRYFDERLSDLFGNDKELGLVLLDIDHFKRINDTYGHAAGDQILKVVANTMKDSLREGTFIARTGGEEFALVIRRASVKDLLALGERIRLAVEALSWKKGTETVKVTVSLGAANAPMVENATQLYEVADTALYQSKNNGRNRLTVFEPHDADTSNRYRMYATR